MDFQKLNTYKNSKSMQISKPVEINVVAVNVGIEPSQYFPKKKDKNGKNMKDSNGRDIRSEFPSGFSHHFVEYGTGRRVIVVLPEENEFEQLSAFQIEGLGFDIKTSNGPYFIQEEAKITAL